MALTDRQLEIISESLVPLFQYLETEVIIDVANRIKNSLAYTRTAELEAESMQRMGYSPAKIRSTAMKLLRSDPEFRKMVAKNTLDHKKTVKKLLKSIMQSANAGKDSVLKDAGDMSYFDDLRIWKEGGKELTDNSFLPQLVEAIRQQTSDAFKNLSTTTGFKTMSGFEAMENLYQRELDKALIKVCTGTFSKEQVIYDVVHSLADSGLRTIDFSSGRSMQLDTAVRLAMRTGAHQLSGKIIDKNIEQTGVNLVRISKHWGARNTGIGHANHEQWQGRVYFIKEGQDYSEEAKRIGQDRITSLWYATGYSVDGEHENDPLGLYGYNCRHRHYPWFEGISTFPKEDPQPQAVTINGKTYDYYAITQKQRSMERAIRALKREREVLKALEMDTKGVNVKIKRKIREYEEFCDVAKVDAKHNRLRYESGTSDLKKTKAWKNMKKIANGACSMGGSFVPYNENADFRINIPRYSDEVNDILSTVARKVAKVGSEHRYEYASIIDIETCAEVDFGTSEEYNSVNCYYRFLREHLEGKYVMIHNHNTHSSLSLPDLQELAMWENLDGVIAVSNDGFINCVVSNGKKENKYLPLKYLEGNYGVDRSLSETERELFMVDLAVQEFAKGGIFVYGE